MTNPSLARQVLLLHRGEGHLRFALPAALCSESALAQLRKHLLAHDGIYRVDCYAGQGKLSIRFQPAVCSLRQVAQRLRDAIAYLEGAGLLQADAAALRPDQRPQQAAQDAVKWLKAKSVQLRQRAVDWRARAAALKSYARTKAAHDPVLRHALPLDERTVIGFLVDITALYLVKVHWELITKRWTQAPFTYRYEWLTIFFLVFLLVRFRKQAPPK